MGDLESIEHIVVVRHAGIDCPMQEGRDVWYHEALRRRRARSARPSRWTPRIRSTSSTRAGSTAKPKGILHTTGGYLTGVSATHRYVFDLKPDDDVYWCSADVGWVTGHSLHRLRAAGQRRDVGDVRGRARLPAQGHLVGAVRALQGVDLLHGADGDPRVHQVGLEHPGRFDLSSLRLLGSVGEPINPKAWLWYHKVIGGERCPIVDTWWQTETGAIMITPLPGITATKPGSATHAFPGIKAEVWRRERRRAGRERPGAAGHPAALAVDAAHALQGGRPLRRDLLQAFRSDRLPGRRRRAPGQGRLHLGDRADRRRGERLRPPPLDRRGRVGDRRPRHGGRGGGDRPGRRGDRPVDLRLRHAPGRDRGNRRGGRRHPRDGRRADRQVRAAEADHLGRRPAEDPVGQDHAPAAARHRRGPGARRRDDAARPGRRWPSSRARSRPGRRPRTEMPDAYEEACRAAPVGGARAVQHRRRRLRQAPAREAGDGPRALRRRGPRGHLGRASGPLQPGGQHPRRPRRRARRPRGARATADARDGGDLPRRRGSSAPCSCRCRCSTATTASAIAWPTPEPKVLVTDAANVGRFPPGSSSTILVLDEHTFDGGVDGVRAGRHPGRRPGPALLHLGNDRPGQGHRPRPPLHPRPRGVRLLPRRRRTASASTAWASGRGRPGSRPLLGPWRLGAVQYVYQREAGFDPAQAARLPLPPPGHQRLRDADGDPLDDGHRRRRGPATRRASGSSARPASR